MEENIDLKVKEKKQVTKEALLNAVSNIFFLLCLWLMTMIVPIIANKGFESGGVFTLALSVAAIATAVATYNIGSFFASDLKKEFSDSNYFYFGLTSCLISLLLAFILCFIYGYSGEIFWSVVFYNIFKMFDNYSFVTRIIYHRHGHLAIFSYLLIGRGVLSFGVFFLSLFISKSLLISMACLAAFGALYFFVELFFLKKKVPDFYHFSWKEYKKSLLIFYRALPVCIYGFCFASMVAVPRLMFENISQNTALLGYFGTMSSVTALIQSATSAILLPFIPKITKAYQDDNPKGLRNYVGVLVLLISALTGVAFVMVVFLGNFALKLIYGEEILQYSSIFKWLVLSTGIQSIAIIFADTLVSLRKFKQLLIGAVTGLAVLLSIMYVFISNYSSMGVVATYLIAFGTALIILVSFFAVILFKMFNRGGENKDEPTI